MKSNHDTNEASDSFTNLVREAVNHEALPPADPALREAVLKRLDQPLVEPALSVAAASRRRTFFQRAGIALVSTAALAVAAFIWQRTNLNVIGLVDGEPRAVRKDLVDRIEVQRLATLQGRAAKHDDSLSAYGEGGKYGDGVQRSSNSGLTREYDSRKQPDTTLENAPLDAIAPVIASSPKVDPATSPGYGNVIGSGGRPAGDAYRLPMNEDELKALPPTPTEPAPAKVEQDFEFTKRWKDNPNAEKAPVIVAEVEKSETTTASITTKVNEIRDEVTAGKRLGKLAEASIEEPSIGLAINGKARADGRTEDRAKQWYAEKLAQVSDAKATEGQEGEKKDQYFRYHAQPQGGEQYAKIIENQFLNPNITEYAQSTFSIDVDTASYANVRRFLNNGQLPPPDAVRLEEMVNYFKYKYPQPKGDEPFSVNTEMADCPWQPGHKLLRVGLQGKEIHRAERPASNIVFLVDTSGSMTDQNKLPLLKQAFTMLVGELNENDKVTMVTYAGNAGLRLPPTRGHEKETIIAAIDGLQSGGSTHGSAGITLAYEVAAAQFIKGGTNKVILATDGDLNVGITDDAALVELITKKAETGVFLTVLGVGTGNLKDAKMERLADNGNGIYAYLDSVREARKVLVEEMSGSLVTIAQDVKIQLEFNPAHVASYRLLGYENRVMANQDFRNDAKDAGEIGAGHSVTAMYEVVMVGAPEVKPADAKTPQAETLRYQRVAAPEAPKKELTEAGKSGELLMVRLRYKKPEAKKEDAAKEVEYPLTDKAASFNSASKEFQFASAVVAFGLSLRNSEFRGSTNLSAVAEMAQPALGEDIGGHRAEFLDLVRRTKSLRGE